ncbi:polyol transporter 5-like [Impatiens glandulifera]|uniref:polyol transporter 5-like n=1 Tax=Impatiens glandulifera TaxID=253017 RepID=UPI001FB16B01|nr:polyol transporter 5-like [Impatiens glandulifera]
MNSILLGYDIGVMSGAGIYIKKDLKLSNIQLEILMGILNVYSLLGSAAAGRTSDWIGRRYTIVTAAVIFFLGALFMGFAPNYAILMVGRFVAGIGVGYALVIAPVYTAEISPASSRGFLTSLPEVFINIGTLLGYISNFAFSKMSLNVGWRLMLGLGAIPAVLIGLGVLVMPESPRWLVMQGRIAEARRTLHLVSDSPDEANLRLDEIKKAVGISLDCNDDHITVAKNSNGKGVWRELFLHPTPAVQHMLLVTFGINFFQQACGLAAVVLYSPKVFEKAGITSDNHKLLATIFVGIVKTSLVFIGAIMLDRFGRRTVFLYSMAGMIVSHASLGTWLTVINQSKTKQTWAIVMAIISVLSFVATFSMGMGPAAWVYCSEIFPVALRAQGVSVGIGVNRVTGGLVSMTFLSLQQAITIGGAFYLFMGVGIVGWIFFYTLLPETRDNSLEEIERLFGRFFNWRLTVTELAKNEVEIGESTKTELTEEPNASS